MDCLTLLDRARAAGLDVQADSARLVVRGPRSAEAIAKELLAHKQEVMLLLKGYRLKHPVSEALGNKQHEMALRRSDLASPFYQGDPWVLEQIALLEGHIAEIRRYLKEGGQLTLPRCCRQADHICLVAVTGFNVCILTPGGWLFVAIDITTTASNLIKSRQPWTASLLRRLALPARPPLNQLPGVTNYRGAPACAASGGGARLCIQQSQDFPVVNGAKQ